MEKQNLTQQKHAFSNQNKCTTTQNKHKKLQPGLVASYDIRPGNGESVFWCLCVINLSLTYLQPGTHNIIQNVTRTGRSTMWELIPLGDLSGKI